MQVDAINLSNAICILANKLLRVGVWTQRGQNAAGNRCLEFPEPVLIRIAYPTNRYCFIPERKWNKTLGWVESLWLARGDNAMDMPAAYVKNLLTFSDDGKRMRAGYGPRLRRFGDNFDHYDITAEDGTVTTMYRQYGKNTQVGIDQLKFVIEKFKQDPTTREASITIHDPVADNFNAALSNSQVLHTKDTPCTRTIHFMIVDGKMNCYTNMRSNDCFTYGTKIPLLNGEVWELGKLAEEKANEEFWVYSRDGNGRIVAGLAHHPRKVRTVNAIIRVTLDNGEIIECTPDHRFMLNDGSYKEIKDIELNESLAPLYRRIDKNGYEEVFVHGYWEKTHKASYESVNGKKKGGRKNVLHHKDFDKRNNIPENLVEMTWDDHIALHAKLVDDLNSKLWNEADPEYPLFEEQRKSIIAALEKGNNNRWNGMNAEEQKAAQANVMGAVCDYLWNAREGFREYIRPIQQENGSKNLKKAWNNPDFVKKVSEAASKRLNDPDVKAYLAELTSERNKKNWADPTYREEMIKKMKTSWIEERRKKVADEMSERSKQMWGNPDFVAFQKETQRVKTTERWQNPEYAATQRAKRGSIKIDQIRKILLSIDEQKLEFSEANYTKVRLDFSVKYPSIENVIKRFGSLENAKAELIGNHKIIKKESIEKEVDVYDLTVEKYHNFALESGVFVHNCIWGFSAVNIFNFTMLQEIVAKLVGVPVGEYYHMVDNFHIYEHSLPMLEELAKYGYDGFSNSIGNYEYEHKFTTLAEFDSLIKELSKVEEGYRQGCEIRSVEEEVKGIEEFFADEPMFQDWAKVFLRKWTKNKSIKFTNPLLNRLYGNAE